MATCTKCATFWTTPGMIHCPICGTSVDEPVAAAEPSLERLQPEAVKEGAVDGAGTKRRNGTAVLEGPKEPQRPKTRPLPPPDPGPGPLPMPPVMKVDDLKVTMFPKPEKGESVEELPGDPMGDPLSVDASVLLLRAPQEAKALPSPARPLNAPIILGALAALTPVLLPLAMAFESHRIIGILGFCLSGFFLPFAPIAWVAGLGAEKRRREQNLRPERRVVVGRLLGQAGTILLVAEATVALILIAGLRLAGSFPSTFWKAPEAF